MFVLVLSGLLMGFQTAADKADATTERIEGLYVFIHSKPKAEYDYLGSIKKVVVLNSEPEGMLNAMLRKLKKEYPTADGIIFTSMNMEKADAIKFK